MKHDSAESLPFAGNQKYVVVCLTFHYERYGNKTRVLTIPFTAVLDIDECMSGNGGCEDTCTNYEGGYYCTCPHGYLLMDDNKGCEGIFSFCLGIM